MTDYPSSIFDAESHHQVDGVDDADADDINVVYDEVEAIESELGMLAKQGGESSFAGFASVSKGIFQKGTSTQRVSESFTFEAGQHFYETNTGKVYKATTNGAGNVCTWEEVVSSSSTVTAHASTHAGVGGSDPLSTGLPNSVDVGDTQSIGSQGSFSRSDHNHACPAGVPVRVGSSNSAGSATTHARSDHVHETSVLTPTYIEWGAISNWHGVGSPGVGNGFVLKDYVDQEVANASGLCLIVGNETIVASNSTNAGAPMGATVKDHRFCYSTTILDAVYIYVAAELCNEQAGVSTYMYIYINNILAKTLSTTSSSYVLRTGEILIADLSLIDNTVYQVSVNLRTSNGSYEARNRTYEFYTR